MKRFVILSLLLISISATAEEKVKPISPKKPIEISVIIDNLGSDREKIEVSLKLSLKKDATSYRVLIHGEHYYDFSIAEAKAVAAALTKLADGMKVGDKIKVGDTLLAVGKSNNGDKYILLQSDGILPRTEALDPDAAEQVAQSLLKAEGMAAWLGERIGPLEKR